MKITDHSEVIGKMIILETDAWQAASRITQKQTFTKSHSYILFTIFLQKKKKTVLLKPKVGMSTGTHFLGNHEETKSQKSSTISEYA